MKKFIKNLTAYALILVLMVAFLNAAFVKMDRSDSYGTNKFKELPDDIQICNFGSSHGQRGYNYEDFSRELQCFNFGLSSQTLSYDERLFQEYREHIGEGTIVFLTVSYFSFFGQPETEAADFESKNKRYYDILSPERIKEYDRITKLLVRDIPILGASVPDIARAFLGKRINTDDLQWQKSAADIDVAESARAAAKRHIVTDKVDTCGDLIINQEEIQALYKLINGCKSRGATPILVTPPYLVEYTDEIGKNTAFYDKFYDILDEIIRDTGVQYYDYAFDERFSQKYEWFIDADHLNKEGARNFVHILMAEAVKNSVGCIIERSFAWQER